MSRTTSWRLPAIAVHAPVLFFSGTDVVVAAAVPVPSPAATAIADNRGAAATRDPGGPADGGFGGTGLGGAGLGGTDLVPGVTADAGQRGDSR